MSRRVRCICVWVYGYVCSKPRFIHGQRVPPWKFPKVWKDQCWFLGFEYVYTACVCNACPNTRKDLLSTACMILWDTTTPFSISDSSVSLVYAVVCSNVSVLPSKLPTIELRLQKQCCRACYPTFLWETGSTATHCNPDCNTLQQTSTVLLGPSRKGFKKLSRTRSWVSVAPWSADRKNPCSFFYGV